ISAKNKLSYYFEHNIVVTTSGNMSQDAFICTKNVLGMDKICFATDYPYESVPDTMDFLDDIPLTVKERAALFYGNAAEHLGIML
ncbi:MAG: amidohydrolase, partial [Lachnospiraceae bacterium]|nr:amidohydrolase [Lachnospiraceae bacterium]